MMNDLLSDSLTRIRNALSAKKKKVMIIYSKMTEKVIKVMFHLGYLENMKVISNGVKKHIIVELKYTANGKSVITGLKRVSKPGLRLYCKKNIYLSYITD